MPRLSSGRRLAIMSGAVAYAEDRLGQGVESVPISEITVYLRDRVDGLDFITEDQVRESLEPLEWVEMSLPGGADIVDLVGAISLENDSLRVEEAWWRRLAVMDPQESSRLYVKAAGAASLVDEPSAVLTSAMRKLRRSVGELTVVEGEEPYVVKELRTARRIGEQVILDIEGHDRTLLTSKARFNVITVFRQGDEWMVTVSSPTGDSVLTLEPGDATTIPANRILGIVRAPCTPTSDELPPSIIDPDPSLAVTVEYPTDRDWVLDPFDRLETVHVGQDRMRSTIQVWGRSELETLALRLGPDAQVLAPEELRSIASEAAAKILAVYAGS
ncbi:MAG: hypothetical protein M3094_07125 [Actinomycetia bacterium]|nr:hypothetical protein [Actinomycetes bacterium]